MQPVPGHVIICILLSVVAGLLADQDSDAVLAVKTMMESSLQDTLERPSYTLLNGKSTKIETSNVRKYKGEWEIFMRVKFPNLKVTYDGKTYDAKENAFNVDVLMKGNPKCSLETTSVYCEKMNIKTLNKDFTNKIGPTISDRIMLALKDKKFGSLNQFDCSAIGKMVNQYKG